MICLRQNNNIIKCTLMHHSVDNNGQIKEIDIFLQKRCFYPFGNGGCSMPEKDYCYNKKTG